VDVGNRQGRRSEINVTPLIDVVLVLLIIFMVLTPSLLKNLPTTVPRKADDATPSPPGETSILIEYTAKRDLTLNGEPVRPEALGAKLAERLSADRQKVVFFKADDESPYGEVVRLMDIARGAGAKTLAVVTK
jgi:biopolymer transport protein TolR